ncbi:hypothetical protein GCM10025859_04790 [Alicyclobacillus fastidiosus]|nr:hypothetical protein GCM10025859_04790 [Alicyclobacillus fastidiosus]
MVEKAIHDLAPLGAEIFEISIPELVNAETAVLVVSGAEGTSQHHENLLNPTLRHMYQEDVRIQLEAGELVSGVEYVKGQKARRLLRDGFYRAFTKVDVIVAPTVPIPAPHFTPNQTKLNFEVLNACTPFTCPANLTGLPSLSIPVGLTMEGLPVGMQIFGKPFAEGQLLEVGYAYEQISPMKDVVAGDRMLTS